MSSDLTLLIFDPKSGAMAYTRWLGGNRTLEKAHQVKSSIKIEVLNGYESWATNPAETCIVAESSYGDGARPVEIKSLEDKFPENKFWWIFEHNF